MSRRKTILIAWELGGNFGHAAEIAQLLPLLNTGHRIVLAVRNPVTVRSIITTPDFEVIAAPHAPDSAPKSKEDRGLSYADVMRFVGWGDTDTLAAFLETWEVLIRLVGADVVVTHAAPTVLLAAQALGVPRTLMGAGYNSPARAVPMPRFHRWEAGDDAGLARREAVVVDTVNAALARRGHAPISAFRDILDVDKFLLTTLSELDHYGDRKAIEPDHPPYLGPIVETHFGAKMTWRPNSAYRILAYLRPGNSRFEAAVRALAALPRDTDVVLAAPGASGGLVEKLKNTPVRLVTGPVNFGSLLPECDLGMSHASPGLVANFALNAIPQIGLPNQTEQTMMAHAMSDSHLGLGLVGNATPEHVLQAIELVKSSDTVRRAADDLAARWPREATQETSARAAEQIQSLL